MDNDRFKQLLENSHRRLKELGTRAISSEEKQKLLAEALNHMTDSLEELGIASAELQTDDDSKPLLSLSIVEQNNYYKQLFELATDGYLITDKAGLIREANYAATQLLNCTAKFLQNKSLTFFMPKEARRAFRARVDLLEPLPQGQKWEVSLKPRKTSVARQVILRVSVIPDSEGQLSSLLWLLYDITDYQKAERQRLAQEYVENIGQELTQEVAALYQLKNDFLSTITHELRLPLTTLKLGLKMLETDVPHLKARMLHILQDACEREINLVNDLLEFQGLDSDRKFPLPRSEKTLIYLTEWLPHVLERFEFLMQQKSQTLTLDIYPENLSILVDQKIFERIIIEFMENAHKFTPEGKTIILKARHNRCPDVDFSTLADPNSSLDTDDFVCASVSSCGVEISQEELPRIFEKFYRIPNNNPWQYSGIGLGLALVERLAQELEGSIQRFSYGCTKITRVSEPTFRISFCNTL